VWADDNNSRNFTRNLFSRQLSGSSVYKGATIGLQSSWPTSDHSATDPAGDVFDALGAREGSCAGMDALGTSAQRSGDTLTVSLTLDSAPNKLGAITCSNAPVVGATGGLWGAEFWAPAVTDPDDPGAPNDNFYVAFVDDPSGPHVGVKPGGGLYSITGLSTYLTGKTNQPPFLRVTTGNSEQADAVAPFDVNGTGQTGG
jgi:hypothetical protein